MDQLLIEQELNEERSNRKVTRQTDAGTAAKLIYV
jgi:hypothetical protein